MAETPDSGVSVWPRQRKPELVLSQVRLVAGAAPNCRRYLAARSANDTEVALTG